MTTRADQIAREFATATITAMSAVAPAPAHGPVPGEAGPPTAPMAAAAPPPGPGPARDTPAPPAATAAPSEALEPAGGESLPQLARSAAGAVLGAAGWTAGTSLRVSAGLRRLAADPASAQQLIEDVAGEVREVARDFLGITELEAEVAQITPLLSAGLVRTATPEALRAQGERLLRAAAEVGFDEGTHPAFARILSEISPDEARILRLLALEGPQPMVDVRASNLIGSGSQLIARALSMLAAQAGLRSRERMAVHLANLTRLHLIVLSDEPLERPSEYQVLEAQPEVMALLRDTARARTVRRSVDLSPLGREFCEICLPLELSLLGPGDPAWARR